MSAFQTISGNRPLFKKFSFDYKPILKNYQKNEIKIYNTQAPVV
jgi:hypothetical protein